MEILPQKRMGIGHQREAPKKEKQRTVKQAGLTKTGIYGFLPHQDLQVLTEVDIGMSSVRMEMVMQMYILVEKSDLERERPLSSVL